MPESEVQRLFVEALKLSPEERSHFLEIAAPSRDLRDAVLVLLKYDTGSETFLENSISPERNVLKEGADQRCGPYKLGELLGRGGMGAVFKGERDDGELRQTVAIKLVERGWFDAHAVERFRQERQILAGLSHPNIARLFDGGTRDDGVPYLVMEYVEGSRIDKYCEENELSIEQRLRLFVPVCDAVEYAHRNLIVHRDLKPANILVTEEGQPKLLDFGVAKVVYVGAGEGTETLVFTPDFASPEQLSGAAVTTATDVYGLGAVLYYLLTGNPPHTAKGKSALELARAVCEQPPKTPSDHVPELKGDLENILLKALHSDPGRRYASAAALAEDLQRYLQRRPVAATPDSFWYVSSRLFARRRVAVCLVAVGVLAILAAAGISIYEARKAANRFAQVRELANHFIFDFEKSIRDVPGTLEARKQVIDTARQYLANLSVDAAHDTGLKRELAEAHYRLSDAEVGMGDSVNGLKDVNEALALSRSLKDDCCGPVSQRDLYIRALVELSSLQLDSGNLNAAIASNDEAIRDARAWLNSSPQDASAQRALIEALSFQWIILQSTGKITESHAAISEAVVLGQKLAASGSRDELTRATLATATNRLCGACFHEADFVCVKDAALRARDLFHDLAAERPNNIQYRRGELNASANFAYALYNLARTDPSLIPQEVEEGRHTYELATAASNRDPKDRQAAEMAVGMTQRYAFYLGEEGHVAQKLELLRQAEGQIDRLLEANPLSAVDLLKRAGIESSTADALLMLKHGKEANAEIAKADDSLNVALQQSPTDIRLLKQQIAIRAEQVFIAQELGNLNLARERCRSGLETSKMLMEKDPKNEVDFRDSLMDLRKRAKSLGIKDPTATLTANLVHAQ